MGGIPIWSVVVVCLVVGYILEWIILRMFFGKKKHKTPLAGHLIVDETDPEEGGGVYLTVEIDPKTFKDGQRIELDIWKVNSQEKHGI